MSLTPRQAIELAQSLGLDVQRDPQDGAVLAYGKDGSRVRLVAIARGYNVFTYIGRIDDHDHRFYAHDVEEHGPPAKSTEPALRWAAGRGPRPWSAKLNPDAGWTRVQAIFDRIVRQVQVKYPKFRARLVVGDPAMFPKERNYAACEDSRPPTVYVAPKMKRASDDRVTAVLAHEIAGHALLFFLGRTDHTEREADAMAERTLGIRIFYDLPHLIQSLRCCKRPRPAHLG